MAKVIRETIVVFQHIIDTDRFPKVKEISEEELKAFLDESVYKLFELKEKEKQLNTNGSHSYIKILEQ